MLRIGQLGAPEAPDLEFNNLSLWIANPGPQNVRIPAHASILDIYLGHVPGRYETHELTDIGWQEEASTSLPRSFCFLPQGRLREIWTFRTGRAVRLAFADEALQACEGEKSAFARRMMHVTDPALLAVASIVSEGLAAAIGRPLKESAEVYSKVFWTRLGQLAGGSNQSGPAVETRPVQKALAFVEDHLGDPLHLADIAQVVGVSPYHFARLFRASLGVSLHQFILSRRVALAERLIFETDASLADVACQAGFSSQSHMTRIFRRLTGRTPGDYRRRRHH